MNFTENSTFPILYMFLFVMHSLIIYGYYCNLASCASILSPYYLVFITQ